MSTLPPDLLPALTADASLVIAGHVTPDADCLGSIFALAHGVTQATGRAVACALPAGCVAARLQFLVDWARPRLATTQDCRQARTMAVCDTAKPRRTNLPDGLNQTLEDGRKIVNIDHHASNTQFGAIRWIDERASSTAELIHGLFRAADWKITPTVASLLYAGILGDTVGFSLSNTSQRALQSAADLVECGADVGRVGSHLFRSQSLAEFTLRRIIYDNTRTSSTGRIAFSTASHQEITRSGCDAADVDDQVEIPRSLTGKRLAILFTEGQPGRVRMNFRSEGDISVLGLAAELGGGGHHAAAGAIIDGTVEEVAAKVIAAAERYLDQLAAEGKAD
jgi:phosphoesterase RecJ-like protein